MSSWSVIHFLSIFLWRWDCYTEIGHFPATNIIELFETPGASRTIVMQIKLYCHSKSSGASSLCWLGHNRGKHGNWRGHSAVKWSARQEPTSQIPQISRECPVWLVWWDTKNTFSWPTKCYHIHGQICLIVELYVVTIYFVNQQSSFVAHPTQSCFFLMY